MISSPKILWLFAIIFVLLLTGSFVKLRTDRQKVAGSETSSQKTVHGIILPHHKLAEELILTSFEKLRDSDYSYIVIFGPNHFVPEANSIVTAKVIDGSSFDNPLMEKFLHEYPDVLVSDEIADKEHSISLHLPYIKEYFPEAKVLPFIISPFAGRSDLDEKIVFLTSILPTDTLFIASVDFAHNVNVDLGIKNNEESAQSINSFDFQNILRFKDDHLDSPLSIYLLLKSMQNFNSTSWENWYSSHSAILEGDPAIQGTSYLIGVFR